MNKQEFLAKVSNIDIDLETGFAIAEDSEHNGLFAVCLNQDPESEGEPKFVAVFDKGDCGWDWGMAGDMNKELGAEDDVFDAFCEIAPKFGLEVR